MRASTHPHFGEVYCWGEAEGGKLGLAGANGDTDYPRKVSGKELINLRCSIYTGPRKQLIK